MNKYIIQPIKFNLVPLPWMKKKCWQRKGVNEKSGK